MSLFHNDDRVLKSLYATVVLCMTHRNRCEPGARPLCTDAIEPKMTFEEIFGQTSNWFEEIKTEQQVVDDVIDRKIAYVVASGDRPTWETVLTEFTNGRFLVKRDQDMAEGLMMEETDGLFDFNDNPPWDCWIAYIILDPDWPRSDRVTTAFLVSWLPAWTHTLADKAIAINTFGAAFWTDSGSPIGPDSKELELIADIDELAREFNERGSSGQLPISSEQKQNDQQE